MHVPTRDNLWRGGVSLFIMAIGLSCGGDGGNAPNPPGGRASVVISIGDTISDHWSSTDDIINYRARALSPSVLTVYAEGQTGEFSLAVTDSATGSSLAFIVVPVTGSQNLFETRISSFNVAAGQVILLRVGPASPVGTFRLLVAEINLAPETGSSQVATGDTVRNMLEHPADVDRFYLHAAARLEMAVFGRSLKDGITISVTDSADGSLLGFGFAGEDALPSHLVMHRTPTFVVPAGHAAQIVVQRSGGVDAGGYELLLYPVNRAPEHVPAAIAINDTVTGEVLENSADIDEFAIAVAAPTELIGYLDGTPQLFPGSAWLTISGAGLASTPNVQHQAGATDLEGSATGRFNVTAGQLKIEVRGVSTDVPANQSGPAGYSVMLRHIDRQPEHLPADLAANDSTAGEQIDYVGDIDEFTVATTAGQTWNGFVHATAASPFVRFQLTVSQAGVPLGQMAQSAAGDTAMAEHFTGNFEAPSGGTLTFAVEAPPEFGSTKRGAYRVFAYRVNRLPESVGPVLMAGDSVLTETIEFPGDVDSFAIAPGAAQAVNLVVARPNNLGHILAFTYVGASGVLSIPCYASQAGPLSRCSSGTLLPPPVNQYALLGSPPGDVFRGSYTLTAYAIDPAPEGTNPVLTLGDTVSEAIDPTGDIDTFTFAYQRGQLLDLWATGGACSSANSIVVGVMYPQDVFDVYANCGVRSGRFDLPQSGTYTVRALGYAGYIGEQGPYRFVLYQYPTMTEHVSPALQPGDSIHGEALDELGDVDDFLLTAAPGIEVQVLTRHGPFSLLEPGDSVSFRQSRNSASGRFVMPAGGQVVVRVGAIRGVGPDINTAYYGTALGPYDIVVHQIDRAPEHVSAALTLGVLVVGEDLPFEGDVDEFTFQGTTGQVVTGTISSPQAFSPGVISFEILDPTGTTVLGSTTTHDGTEGSTGPITLPGTGTYIVRVLGQDDTQGTGAYQFMIQ